MRSLPDARALWTLTEPLHAVVYFAPQVREAGAAVGVPGFWAGYFAMRAAPLGRVSAPAVVALFHGFAPGFVGRWVPAVWDDVSPADALVARATGAAAALHAALGVGATSPAAAEAAGLARRAAEAVDPAGRPLAAGEAAVPLPGDPVGDLWQSLTVLREHRGDGHVATLTTHELDGLEAHVLRAADQGASRDWLLRARGWTEAEWDDAARRLADRGLVSAGRTTPAGRELRAAVEADTDRLATAPWRALSDHDLERLAELVAPLRRAVVEAGLFPPGNPIGVPELPATR